MPFLTEELWHDEDVFGKRTITDCCIVAKMPEIGQIDTQLLAETELVKDVVTKIRDIRQSKQISPKETLNLSAKSNSGVDYTKYKNIIIRLANIGEFTIVKEKITDAIAFTVSKDEFFAPLALEIDAEAEKERLQKEKEYLLGFLRSVEAKLGNERFMQNAKPEIVENELKKKADAQAKLAIIDRNLTGLAG